MITSITFDTPIGTEYKRNNRSTRQKSLRCFPTCGIKGHITGGFCGRPLKVVVEIERESSSLNIQVEDYRFIAEIHPVSQPGVSKAKTIKEEDLARQIRSKYDKYEVNGEIFQADSINILQTRGKYVEIELTFNSQHCSWDYSWKSNRWSGPQEQHVVDIIVLKSLNTTEAKIVSFGSSSSFVVSSSHKKPVKAIQIKDDDDDDELLCIASTTAASKGTRRSRASRTNEERSNAAIVGTEGGVMMAKLISADSHEFRGSLESSTRQLQISADGKSLSFAPYTGGSSSHSGGVVDQESLNEGANALIMLAVSSGPTGASTTATSKAAKKDKRILANEEATSLKKIKSEAVAPQSEASTGYPYPPPPHHYQYPPPYGGYPPPGYPPMPPPYGYFPYPPPPYPYPPPEHADSHDGAAGKSKTASAAKSPYPEPYPPYHHHMYAHMYGYGPPPNQQHQAGTAPPPLSYPPMMFPYPYGGPTAPPASSKKNRPTSAPVPSPFPPSFDLRHPYPPHHAPGPYPHPPVAVGYPVTKQPAATAEQEEDSASTDDAGSDGEVTETEKASEDAPSSPKCTTLVPACGSAEKIKSNRQSSVSLSPTEDDSCLPEALPVNEDTESTITIPITIKEATLMLNKRPTHCIAGSGDFKIREPRKENEMNSVFDVIQQRIRGQQGPITTSSGNSSSTGSSDNENI